MLLPIFEEALWGSLALSASEVQVEKDLLISSPVSILDNGVLLISNWQLSTSSDILLSDCSCSVSSTWKQKLSMLKWDYLFRLL